MVMPVKMSKRSCLGYADESQLGVKIGTRIGLEVWADITPHVIEVTVVDRQKIRSNGGNPAIAMILSLTKCNNAWHVDIVRTDSRYKGRSLAVRVYVLIMKKLSIQLQAGGIQSVGGRYIWNKLALHKDILVYARKQRGSIKLSLPKSGKSQLHSIEIDLYGLDNAGTDAEIYAIAI